MCQFPTVAVTKDHIVLVSHTTCMRGPTFLGARRPNPCHCSKIGAYQADALLGALGGENLSSTIPASNGFLQCLVRGPFLLSSKPAAWHLLGPLLLTFHLARALILLILSHKHACVNILGSPEQRRITSIMDILAA